LGWLESLRTRIAGPERTRAGDDELFDDDFQRKLEYLALVSRRVFAGRIRAERRTKKTGSGVEFADHREYQAGDDIRYLDWNVFQRFDKLLLRLYEEEEDLAIYFVLDASASMAFAGTGAGAGRKLTYAKRITAALAYVALANLDRVEIVTTNDRVMGRMPETRGKARIFKIFRFLRETKPAGITNLEDALRAFVAQHKRRGIVVLVSDLYDPAGFERGINVLRYNKFEPFVVHVMDPEEARPKLQGDVLVYDCETGDEREVTVTGAVLERFAKAYEEYVAQIEKFCSAKQVPYVRADVSTPFDEMVLRVFRRGGFLR
jgi:uncharacterized protein (DUF58 family)